ncbi:MAG TPA: GDSL-type esterase/lipase family protein, partial [Niabella sp.]|nr:GDSL-type esterase/lipase family protein [Niabella sp.]
ISKTSNQPVIIKASGNGKHTVQVYKATEAHSGPVYIEKITGNEVQAVPPPDVSLIEFIGNSITCGAFSDGSTAPCATGAYQDQYNAFYAYGPRIARALDADFILSSVSGIGIYRNWDSNGPTMPQLYEYTDFTLNSYRKWNFNIYKPKIVSIALGTNDCNDGNGATARSPFNSDTFITKYIEFVKLVKSKYPLAKIVLLSSPVVAEPKNIMLQNCLNAVKAGIDQEFPGDTPVTVYFLKEMNPTGCSGHPGVADHGVIANELIPVFRDNLN